MRRLTQAAHETFEGRLVVSGDLKATFGAHVVWVDAKANWSREQNGHALELKLRPNPSL